MRFRARKTFKLGPFLFRFTQRGLSSVAIKVGRVTHNLTRGTTTVDTPGPGAWHFGGRKRGAR